MTRLRHYEKKFPEMTVDAPQRGDPGVEGRSDWERRSGLYWEVHKDVCTHA